MTDDSLAFEDKLELRSWGLPEYILQKYQNRGIRKMFPWQLECLMSENVLLGGNLIYSAPTSAGKTLVAEILALKTVLERKKKVLVILPFVSVVREKMIYFQDILCGSGIKVEGFMGSYNPPGGFKNVHLAVCTIEKANGLINRLLEEKNFDDIGCIVVDELHLLGDPHRGYLLELLLTKVKYVCQKGLSPNIQVVGMSATLPNLDLLATWLNATLYHTEFRPIPLFEYLKIGRTVYKSPGLTESFELKTVCEIQNDPGDVVSICLDTIIQGYSILVFCPTKNWCETLAVQISTEIKRLGNEKDEIAQSLRKQLNSRGIFDTLEQLKKCPAGLEKNLGRSVSFGVAYHHAGLTLDERDIVEGGFRQSIIRVLVATSTLSSGVNLPARRVIIRSPSFQGQCMDILTYKQMIGRAGRMGKDTAGESYLICTELDKTWGKQLITSSLPPAESCLGLGDLSNSLKRALLEVIAGGVVTNSDELQEYTRCTLLAASANDERILKAIDSCTNYLKQNEFIKMDLDGGVLPSSLAEACLSSSVPPDQALYLLRELHKARQCFVLDSDLHAIYQVTPYSICDSWAVDWMTVFTIWENLPENLQKIGDLVGVEDRFLIRAMRSTINLNSDDYAHKVSIHKRFYTSLALQDLINEVPLNEVAEKYGCTKGMLQSLQQSASTFAAMVTSFCRRLGWGGLEVLLSELATRIQFGVQKELLDLLRLDCMSGLMARALFTAGITTLSELASSTIQNVQLALNKAKPFQSELIEVEAQVKRNVYLPGRPGLSEKEAASLLIFEARRFLLKEMGVKTAEWDDKKTSENVSSIDSLTIQAEDSKKDIMIADDKSSYDDKIVGSPSLSRKSPSKRENVSFHMGDEHSASGKSSQVELNIDISIKHNVEQNDCALADTEIINEPERISPIRRVNNVEMFENTIVPESQDTVLINDQDEYKAISQKREPKYEDPVTAGPIFKLPLISEGIKDSLKNTASTSIGVTDTTDFPAFELNAKVCSSFFLEDKKNSDNKCSMEVLYGSPNRSDADFMSSLFDKVLENNSPSLKFSTPVNKVTNGDLMSNSNNDLFSDSPQEKCPDIKGIATSEQILENFDPNWGGDSLLELSQNFEKQFQSIYTPRAKRKLIDSDGENTISNKRIRLIKQNKKIEDNINVTPKASATKPEEPSFGDSLLMNTQLENIVKANESKFLESPIKNKEEIESPCSNHAHEKGKGVKLTTRTKSDGYLLKSAKKQLDYNVSMTDTVLASAFDGSFKLGELIEDAKKDVQNDTLEDVHISDSEDVISRSPEKTPKSKKDLSSHISKSMRRKSKSFNTSSKSSPISSPNRHQSPQKYPPIGLDILKIHKSPSRVKLLSTSSKTPENSPKDKIKYSTISPLKINSYKENNLVDVLASGNTNGIIEEIIKLKELVIVIETKKILDKQTQQAQIGGRINRKMIKETEVDPQFKIDNEALISIYLYAGSAVYFFNMITLGTSDYRSLKYLFNQQALKLYSFNIRSKLKLFYKCFGYIISCKLFDLAIADWILNPEEKHRTLEEMAAEFLTSTQVSPAKQKTNISSVLVLMWDLQKELNKMLQNADLLNHFEGVEMPIQSILLFMELTGIRFKHDIASELWSSSTELMGQLEIEAFSLAKHKFSLNSNSDLAKIKKELGISSEEEADHPLIMTVQNWRKLYSLKTRNLSQLLFKKDERIHSKSTTFSATGRILMFEPDLQHIPRDFYVGEKLFSLRSAFVASPGTVLVTGDYSQLELRILAHFSKDPVLVPLLRKGDDVFKNIAAEWNGMSPDKINDELRHQVKQLTYGIIYGMGDKALGEALGKTPADASMLSARFKRSFPKLDDFVRKTIEECRQTGQIKTLTGRARPLPGIKSSNTQVKAQAERQAVNSKIQGSASDIAKKAMIEIENTLNRKFPGRSNLPTSLHTSHLVHQLHDEFIYEVEESILESFIPILKSTMENSTFLSVPLPVVIKSGKSWGQLWPV